MRIAFAAEHPRSQGSFSGTPYHMSKALAAEAEYFQYIECPSYDLRRVISGSGWGQEAAGQFLSDRVRDIDVDVIICSGSCMIPFLKTEKRVVLWHDSTWFSLLQEGFESFQSKYPLLYEWDCRTLERCDLIAFAADWVRDQVIQNYGAPAKKIHLLPFGANIEPVSLRDVSESIAARNSTPCRLTFLGKDWARKGLPLAYKLMSTLKMNGLNCELAVIGCHVPEVGVQRRLKHYLGWPFHRQEKFRIQYCQDKTVRKFGFLSKDEQSQYRLLIKILRGTHFLLHPASFECFGIALVEANAFGVPVLATNNHGPRSIIRNGINGYLFERGDYVGFASKCITHFINDPKSYEALALSSFKEYDTRLNWRTSCRKLSAFLSQ